MLSKGNAKEWSHDPHGSILFPLSAHVHMSHGSIFSPLKKAFFTYFCPDNQLQKIRITFIGK